MEAFLLQASDSVVHVPYDFTMWTQWARAVLTSISSGAGLGFLVFTVFFGINVFKVIIRWFFG